MFSFIKVSCKQNNNFPNTYFSFRGCNGAFSYDRIRELHHLTNDGFVSVFVWNRTL